MKLGARLPDSFGEKTACLLASALVSHLKLDQSKYIEVDLVDGDVRIHDRVDLLDLNDAYVTSWVTSGKPLVFVIRAKHASGMEFAVLPVIPSVVLS